MEKKRFPGPIAMSLLKDAKTYYATNTMGSRVSVARRAGAVVEDHDGFKFVDFHCDASVNNLGGNHPKIHSALHAQINTGNIFSEHHNAPNLAAVELAKLLALKSPVPNPAKVYLANSGAEANETAIKLCKAYRFIRGEEHRKKAIYFTNAFHGRTLGILPGTNSKPEVQRDPFWNHCDQENSIYFPYPAAGAGWDWKEILRRLNDEYAEVDRLIIELPCQGEGGIIPADENYVKLLYDFAHRHGIFFIVDAIQCGMGRTGTLFGCDRWEWLKPDILTLGKALGGGIPVGATIFRADLDFAKPGMHSSTFGGGPMVSRVGLAVFNETEKLIEDGVVTKLEERLKGELAKLQEKFPALICETRGLGAMWAHEIVSDKIRNEIIRRAEELASEDEYGLRLLGAGRNAIRFMPPLNISPDMLDFGLSLYEKVLSSL
ncbi:MAG: aspartate aminotransferase family protein [Candidatus Sungiibacteriota bacterium]